MNDGPSYAAPIPLGGVIVGQTVSRVMKSPNQNFAAGELVVADAGWQPWSVSDGSDLLRVPPDLQNPALAFSALGMLGFTAYIGLLDVGRPRAGETLLVSAATGGVGSIVDGLAAAPQAFIGLLEGRNVGKLIIRVGTAGNHM